MLATLILVFREVLEAGLIIGIVMTATHGVARRGRMISYGVLGGIIGACVVASFANAIAALMSGTGLELFHAAAMIVAVLMLTWHNVWMAREGRHIAQSMKSLGDAVAQGNRSLAALAIVVGLAVLREGSEVALFLYGVALSNGDHALAMLAGGLIGLALGCGVSAALSFGMLRIPTRYVFTVTSWVIALLAAGMASQAVAFLQQAGIVTLLSQPLWNSSGLLSLGSLLGKALHTLIGYTDRPTGIQLAVYALTLSTIFCLMKTFGRPAPAGRNGSAARN